MIIYSFCIQIVNIKLLKKGLFSKESFIKLVLPMESQFYLEGRHKQMLEKIMLFEI